MNVVFVSLVAFLALLSNAYSREKVEANATDKLVLEP
jgi:hypothetical protein